MIIALRLIKETIGHTIKTLLCFSSDSGKVEMKDIIIRQAGLRVLLFAGLD